MIRDPVCLGVQITSEGKDEVRVVSSVFVEGHGDGEMLGASLGVLIWELLEGRELSEFSRVGDRRGEARGLPSGWLCRRTEFATSLLS